MVLQYRQHDVYLTRNQDVVEHASRLYSAGVARSVFAVDESPGLGRIEKILLFPLLYFFRAQPNPHVSRFDVPSHGRNKLMIFDSWVIRCTYQQYVAERHAELFYYSGSPVDEIRHVSCSPDNISISCAHGDLGGSMYASPAECDRILRAFEELKRKGRIPADASVG